METTWTKLMETTWTELLNELVRVRHTNYRTDPDRAEARLEALEFVVKKMLEKLRDEKQS